VRLLRCDVQYDLYEALDSRSSDAEELASVLFAPGPGGGLSELALAAVAEPYAPTFLLVDHVAIAPPWRGRPARSAGGGAAAAALRRGCRRRGAVRDDPGTGDADREVVHEGLRRYYGRGRVRAADREGDGL